MHIEGLLLNQFTWIQALKITPSINIMDIAKIPDEIIARIFSAGTLTWREVYPNSLPFPMLVCGVCRRWKHLALNRPELWAFVVPPLHLFRTAQSSEYWVSQWLFRSGDLSVSIVIDDRLRTKGNHSVHESQAVVLGVLRGIGRHSPRLRRLDIWSQHVFPNDLNALFQHGGEPMRLRQLSLCCGRITQTQIIPNTSPQTSVMFSWFERLPRLHKLRVAGGIFPVVSPLTSLCVHGLCARYSEIQTIFATCPNIKSLALPGLLPIALPLPSPLPPIVVLSLKSIAVSFKRVPHLDHPYPVSVLRMPNLENLEIEGDLEISWAFDSSLASSKVQKFRLAHRSRGLGKEDQILIRSFVGLRCLQLIDASTEGLLVEAADPPTMARKRSIGSVFSLSSSSSISSASTTHSNHDCWPRLTDITMSTTCAEDVMRLCRYVQLHRGIRTIRLSRNARRHLSESLVRDKDIVRMKDPGWKRKGLQPIDDVYDWLGKLADIKVFRTTPGSHLDRERFPMHEL